MYRTASAPPSAEVVFQPARAESIVTFSSGFVFLALAVLAGWLTSTSTRITCGRGEIPRCLVEEGSMFGRTQRTVDVQRDNDSFTVEKRDGEWRITVEGNRVRRRYDVLSSWIEGRPPVALEMQIMALNVWIVTDGKLGQETLVERPSENERWISWSLALFGFLTVITFFWAGALARRVTRITVERSDARLHVVEKRWPRALRAQSAALVDIHDVFVEEGFPPGYEHLANSPLGKRNRRRRVVFRGATGNVVVATDWMTMRQKSAQSIAEKIQRALSSSKA